ncbi:MAG TPA: hypothetical protein VII06_36370 [Chloroflexota bacterium]
MMSDQQPVNGRAADLNHRLQALEMEYDRVRRSLDIGLIARDGAIPAVLACLVVAAVVLIFTGRGFLGDEYFGTIIGIVAVGLVIYFVLGYGRLAKIRFEIARTHQLLNTEPAGTGR